MKVMMIAIAAMRRGKREVPPYPGSLFFLDNAAFLSAVPFQGEADNKERSFPGNRSHFHGSPVILGDDKI
jgi:hypothetical protein